ncbi:ADP-heptose--lipooligosaccharide heptosyltransferase II [hydrothermal vent metagenome]|uniref:ADP-heptose--lipooligosaccharide heptosyltransferase II n=1 Tax=hydrothermal vent metagenome TaxID=652676 RepID=A0A3B1AW36_9ZZZZ
MQITTKKILLIRNDKLGDFMLAFPAFAQLKQNLPDVELHVLVPKYTRPLADACDYIDQIIIDPGEKEGFWTLAKQLRNQHYDVVISLYSTTRVALATLMAGIPERIAPATKLAQIFYTKRLTQRRSLSQKPEYSYNQDLVDYYLRLNGITPAPLPEPPFLRFDDEHIQLLRQQFCDRFAIKTSSKLIFIHPGSGGSAANLSLPQFARLARKLHAIQGTHIIISCGPGEEAQAGELCKLLGDDPHTLYISKDGLRLFAEHIQFADLFISGSTGPLHIAGALNRPTAAFYTRRQSATSLRWQTLNSEDCRLAFSPPEKAENEDMGSIDIEDAARQISERFLN